MASHLWNIQLSEALYPSLQTLEVALRNSFHLAATDRFSNNRWCEDSTLFRNEHEIETVKDALAELQREKKPLEPDRIVAELNFGFWTSLFNRRYEQVFWPWMLKPVFPHMPASSRTRHTLSARLNEIRKLRNRIFHHERINHWSNLDIKHSELLETIAWISPSLRNAISAVDRFPSVLHTGLEKVRHDLCHAMDGGDYSI